MYLRCRSFEFFCVKGMGILTYAIKSFLGVLEDIRRVAELIIIIKC